MPSETKEPWLEQRFEAELRPYLLNETRERLTLQLWLEEFLGKEDA